MASSSAKLASPRSSFIVSAKLVGLSISHRRPFFPLVISSCGPSLAAATTGFPCTHASKITFPRGSCRDGQISASTAASKLLVSDRHPRNRILSEIFKLSAIRINVCFCGPSPANQRKTSGIAAKASRSTSKPLFSCNLPSARIMGNPDGVSNIERSRGKPFLSSTKFGM